MEIYLCFLNDDNDEFIDLVKEYNDGLILFLNTSDMKTLASAYRNFKNQLFYKKKDEKIGDGKFIVPFVI